MEDFERKLRLDWEQYNGISAFDYSSRLFSEKEMIDRIAKNLAFWTLKKNEYVKPMKNMSIIDYQIFSFLSESYFNACQKAKLYPNIIKDIHKKVQDLISVQKIEEFLTEKLLVEEVIEKFVNINNFGNCLLSSIVLHELFSKQGIKSTIIKGYKHILNQNFGYLHFWVKCENGNQYDVGQIINRRVFKKNGKIFLDDIEINILELPEDVERIDMETEEEIATVHGLNTYFTLYLQDPSKYWSYAPEKIVNLRNSLLGIDKKRKNNESETCMYTRKEILDSFDIPGQTHRKNNKKKYKKRR